MKWILVALLVSGMFAIGVRLWLEQGRRISILFVKIVVGSLLTIAIVGAGVFLWESMSQDTQGVSNASVVEEPKRSVVSVAPRIPQFNEAGCVLEKRVIIVNAQQKQTIGKEECQIAFEVISDGTVRIASIDSSGNMILRESRFGRGDAIDVNWPAYQNKMYVKANRGLVSFRFRFCPQNAKFDPEGCIWKGHLYRFTLSSTTGTTVPVEEHEIGSPYAGTPDIFYINSFSIMPFFIDPLLLY